MTPNWYRYAPHTDLLITPGSGGSIRRDDLADATYVQAALDDGINRMLSDGVTYRDVMTLRATLTGPDDWCDGWMKSAQAHEDLGRAALARGATLTAGEALWRAALYCHLAQGYFTDNLPDKKRRAELRKQSLFREAAPLLSPPLTRVDIPFRSKVAPGYLRLPLGITKPPCVLIFGGLDSTKEDALTMSNLIVERGVATLAFDGPGQGEMFAHMKLIPDYEAVVSAAIDFLESRPEIDACRIGVIGRSTGGHWACQAAGKDKRVKAAVAWGLAYHARNIPQMPPTVQNRWRRACGLEKLEDVVAYFKGYDLEGVATRITCPLMIVQGARDPIVPPESLERVTREAKGPIEVLTWPDCGHCCHERHDITKPAMADFLARNLAIKT